MSFTKKKYTRIEIYNNIVSQIVLKMLIKDVARGPDNELMSEDKCRRVANREAVKMTWYYFNHQNEFIVASLFEPNTAC